MSKSDPICHVHVKRDNRQAYWTKLASTEQLNDNLNPNFQTPVTAYYYFERHQPIRFEVLDSDGKKFELIGDCETTVGYIMGAENMTFKSQLKNKKGQVCGTIGVKADKMKDSNWDVKLQVGARDLP